MKKNNFDISIPAILVSLALMLFSCGNTAQSDNHADIPAEQELSITSEQIKNTCIGMPPEADLRKILDIPDAAVSADMSQHNIAAQQCVAAFGDEAGGGQYVLTIIKFDDIAASLLKNELKKAPEEDWINGIGESAFWKERKRTKSHTESTIVIIEKDFTLTLTYDHPATLDKEKLQSQLKDVYRQWLKAYK